MAGDTLKLKHPIVLIHGLGARHRYGPVDYFFGIPSYLRQAGNRVFIPSLTPWHSIDHRAEQLKKQIEDEFGEEEPVNLIGHSMGGLDARYLASRFDMGERIASITTLGTPNRGSFLGDIAVGLVPERAFQGLDRALGFFKQSSAGFRQLSVRHHDEKMRELLADNPKVAYFSATSAIPEPVRDFSLPIFWVTHGLLKAQEGDNDGMVSVESSKWGTHICTYRGDHYGQIGQILGRSRGLDHYAMFDEIVRRLHREGF
jgi:triacylglycerol lipase